jgi:hypothetical protein
MKKIITTLAVFAMLTGCENNIDEIIDGTKNNTAPDYSLRYYNAERKIAYAQHALNIPGANELSAMYTIKNRFLQLRIGYMQPWPNMDNLYTIISFPASTRPEEIVGIYEYPAANSIAQLLMIHAVNGDTTRRTTPDGGKLEVRYNVETKTLYGKLDNISFNRHIQSVDSMDVLKGKFNHVPYE